MIDNNDLIKCPACKRVLDKIMFIRNDIAQNYCNICAERKKQWALDNKDKLSEKRKQKYLENKDAINKKNKEYRDSHKDLIKECNKIYRENHIQKIKDNKNQWALDNKDKISEKRKQKYLENCDIIKLKCRNYYRNNRDKIFKKLSDRYYSDPQFKFRRLVSISIARSLKNNGSSKGNQSITKYLPYTMQELKDHLESLFESWMNWSNHGSYNYNEWKDDDPSTWKWQIDHIIPNSSFNYTSMEDDDFKLCWALENLRPLSAKKNNMKSNKTIKFAEKYIIETRIILSKINKNDINLLVDGIKSIKDNNGRLFILGVGGSYSTASHAVNDFRKICELESYCPADNCSFLTAITNDMGWENSFIEYMKSSNLCEKDSLLILSVGGGNQEKNVSMNLVKAIDYAKSKKSKVFGIVGRDGGYTKHQADVCVVIPNLYENNTTPHVEGITSVLLHLIVTHPNLKVNNTKW